MLGEYQSDLFEGQDNSSISSVQHEKGVPAYQVTFQRVGEQAQTL
jgi:hypothetical protein